LIELREAQLSEAFASVHGLDSSEMLAVLCVITVQLDVFVR